MSSAKSQFVLGGYNQGNFLLDSLSVAAADTRQGLDPTTATRLAAMQGYVNANPDKTNPEQFKGYVNKLVGASTEEAKPVPVAQRKPGNGMM